PQPHGRHAQTGIVVRHAQIPGAGADEMQPKRREGTLVSSRLNDRQRSNAGARMLVVSSKPSGSGQGACICSPKTILHLCIRLTD
ncbi:hypothetical protein COCSADRAFT_88340, partial [Bipolaris sorokiniana ND90Pr]